MKPQISLGCLFGTISILTVVLVVTNWYVFPGNQFRIIKAYSEKAPFDNTLGSLVLADSMQMRIVILGYGSQFQRVQTIAKYYGGIDLYVDGHAIAPSSDLTVILLEGTGMKRRDIKIDLVRHLLIDSYTIRLPNDQFLATAFKRTVTEPSTGEEEK